MRQVPGLVAVVALGSCVACLPTPQCRTSRDCPPPQTCKEDGWCEYPNGTRLTLALDSDGSSSSGSSSSSGGCTVAQLSAPPNTQCLPLARAFVRLGMGCTLLELDRGQLAGSAPATCTASPAGVAALFDVQATEDSDVTVNVTANPMAVVAVEDALCGMATCSSTPTAFRVRPNAAVPLWIVQAPGAGTTTLTVRFDAAPKL